MDASEASSLAADMSSFLSTMSVKQGSGYQCLVCSSVHRDLYNLRIHLMAHMQEDSPLIQRLDEFMAPHVFKQSNVAFTCFLCKRVIKRRYKEVRAHFVSKHLVQATTFVAE